MAVKVPVYLDYNATTPVDPLVFERMKPYFCEIFGNAASRSHAFGWQAEEAVETARSHIAGLIGASEKEIVFTSGATESDNLAIKGVAEMYSDRGRHIITARTEHKAVIDSCRYLAEKGYEITWLDVDENGQVSCDQLQQAIRDDTTLITIMAANNETGALAPIGEIGRIAKARNVLFHTDATQAAGKLPLDVEAMEIDLLSLSGHKMYGPKGVGALYVRRRGPRVRLTCQMHGGGHERGLRSGTLNVAGIVGMGAAAELAAKKQADEAPQIQALRDRLESNILSRLDHVQVNAAGGPRLCNTSNISFAYVEGEALMMKVSDLAVSSGSACTSASLEPSHVLNAMGVGDDLAHSSIRFSLGRFSTEEEVDFAADRIVSAVTELRQMSPLYEMAQKGVDLSSFQWKGH
jgi:cysteine desulfurase